MAIQDTLLRGDRHGAVDQVAGPAPCLQAPAADALAGLASGFDEAHVRDLTGEYGWTKQLRKRMQVQHADALQRENDPAAPLPRWRRARTRE